MAKRDVEHTFRWRLDAIGRVIRASTWTSTFGWMSNRGMPRLDPEERIRAAEDVLNRVEVRSNINGTIVGHKVHTPGGVIVPDEVLMDSVPDEEEPIVEARLSPRDIDVTRLGMDAMMRLAAFNQRHASPIAGRVISMSADQLTDPRKSSPYFLARLRVIENLDARGIVMLPGMEVEVMIITNRQNAFANFMEPIANSLHRAFREH